MDIAALARRYALPIYFALAFCIAWGGVLSVVGAERFNNESTVTLGDMLLMFLAMSAGTSVPSLLLTAIISGRAGLRQLRAAIVHWRVGPGWYAVVLLTTPILMLTVLLVLTMFVSPAFIPGFAPAMLAAGLLAGLLEEVGWTWFALPRLREKYGVLTSGLLLGIIWGVWHFGVYFPGASSLWGELWLPKFLVVWIVALTAYRVLMVFVYESTKSLLLAILMHASLTGSLLTFGPSLSPTYDMLYNVAFASILWVVVGIVIMARAKRHEPAVSRQLKV